MKSIVIAAGYATRLYPLTENFPKPLLQIGDSTILDRLLDDVDQIPVIKEHIVVTNHQSASSTTAQRPTRDGSGPCATCCWPSTTPTTICW